MLPIIALVFWTGLALGVGALARRRNRSFLRWTLAALVLSPALAIFLLLLIFPPAVTDLISGDDDNPYALGAVRHGAYAGTIGPSPQQEAERETQESGQPMPSRLLVGVGVLALAVLAPAVWFSTSLHATNDAAVATVPSLPKDVAELAWELPSSRPAPPAATDQPTHIAEAVSELSLLPTPTDAPAAETGVVTYLANLRAGPGTDYAIVGLLDRGSEVVLAAQDETGEWYQLANGEWIAAFLVTRIGAAGRMETASGAGPPTVNVVQANLRSGPSTDFEIAGTADAGQALVLAGVDAAGEWYQLVDGRWIYAELVNNAPPDLPVVGETAP